MTNKRAKRDGRADAEARQRAKQRNTVWPDTLRGAYDVDRFLFSGAAKPTRVQRIGMLIFALIFSMPGLLSLYFAIAGPGPAAARGVLLLIAAPFLALGLRLLGSWRRRR